MAQTPGAGTRAQKSAPRKAPAPQRPAVSPTSPSSTAKAPASTTSAPSKAAGEKEGAAPEGAEEAGSKDLVGTIVDFIVGHAVWIVGVIALGLGLVIWLTIRGVRRKEAEEEMESGHDAHTPHGHAHVHAHTHPPVDEDEGPRRVLVGAGAPAAAPDTEEKDYALVVKQEDLAMPPVPEESAPARRKVDSAAIEEMIGKKDFEGAYRQYVERISGDGRSEVKADVERRLGDYFLQKGDLEKAAKVLEHHVATHAVEEIEPVTYFNLGYIHFRGKTLAKTRRYFRLFVERHKDPAQVDRARKLLSKLERVQNMN